MPPRRFNAAAHFVDRQVSEGRGDRLALITGGERLTYAEVRDRVNRAGNALKDRGIGRGDRVLLRLPDGPEFVACFFGAIKSGAVPVPLNTQLKPRDYDYIEQDSGARFTVDPDWPLDADPADLEPADTAWDDPCFWLYTSGTTGTPKAAIHLQHDMLVCCDGFGRHVIEIREDDRCYSVAKLFFAYGLGNALYFPFHVGASAVLNPERFDPERSFEIIQRERPTLFYAVPTAYAAMLQVDQAERRFDLSSLRVCSSAGEPLPRAIYERWRSRFGLEILDGIGSTELCHTFIANRAGRARPGSSGEVVPG